MAQANNSLLTTSGFGEAVSAALSEIGRALQVDRAFIFEVSGSDLDEFHSFAIKHEWLRRSSTPGFLAKASLQNAPFEQYCPGWYELLVEKGIVRIDSDTGSQEEIETLQVFKARALLAIPMWKDGRLFQGVLWSR